ncbi:MAG: TolC family protein [Saprospiraceae bacterium]|nr:TolC family protein [Saprospiraceae bacterium]
MTHLKIFFLILLPGVLPAQDSLLSAVQAVEIALENNYAIRISRTDAEVARLNNTKANAGMLPTLNLVASDNFTVSAFQQQLANGNEFNDLGATFNTFNAGVQLGWTIFDGRRMYRAKDRLALQEALGDMNLRAAVQRTTAAVLQTYYGIAASRLQEQSLEEVIALNEERLRIAEARLAAGFATQNDGLQARIDLNQRRGDLLAQQNTTQATKRNLNLLLARDPLTPFSVDENLENVYVPERVALLEGLQTANPELLAALLNEQISAVQVAEAEAVRKPRISTNSQLNALRTDNTSGFLLNNSQAGLTLGLAFSLPIYDGGLLKSRVKIAQLDAQRAALSKEANQLDLETRLDNQLAEFATQQQILVFEEENVINARESLNISTERFRLGQTNSLEVQQAQSTFEQALVRRNLLLFRLKQAEVQLKLLAGQL